MVSFVDVLWGGNTEFETIINNLKQVFCIGTEHTLSQSETTKVRGILGKLNWIAGMTRPEISFLVRETSTQIKDARVSNLISTKKW